MAGFTLVGLEGINPAPTIAAFSSSTVGSLIGERVRGRAVI